MVRKPFTTKYNWNDFDNIRDLSEFQKYRIRRRFKREVKEFIQGMIDESMKDKRMRRSELNAHSDPNDPFKLDIGGEG